MGGGPDIKEVRNILSCTGLSFRSPGSSTSPKLKTNNVESQVQPWGMGEVKKAISGMKKQIFNTFSHNHINLKWINKKSSFDTFLPNCALNVQCTEKCPAVQLCSAVWVKVDGVQFSEMRSGLKMVSPPGFLCNTDKEIQCILICF